MEQLIDLILTTLIILSIVSASFAFFYYLSPKIRAEFLFYEKRDDIIELASALNLLSHLYYNSSMRFELSEVYIKCIPNGILFMTNKHCKGYYNITQAIYFNNKTAIIGNNVFTEIYPNLYYGCIGKLAYLYRYPSVKPCEIDCKHCRLLFIKTEGGLEIR